MQNDTKIQFTFNTNKPLNVHDVIAMGEMLIAIDRMNYRHAKTVVQVVAVSMAVYIALPLQFWMGL